ncbi:hypothetical protein SAMD00019534_097270 [Acytostelium subglobosum LB1]|uniref:hypothetical protein n=1 Tax=Acytostelium subglobosum LB1 TaxID=1410327 RepID=UPI000644C18D|nr:hypothetical protein SAMD00019534_097270 [Acytostelium subglobosum LB1]GAM26552.1 hypothetical protein SAMD00019534_097270 [Acytostelium subglobosum LB1]|eukprot:XP_012750648.1 hypothetical protein SAMD00019534_097270 [Acytostelium subglobosum LB1]
MSHDCNDPNHSHDVQDGVEFSLNKYIDSARVTCLNEKVKGSACNIFKQWENRLDTSRVVESCDDAELIINIPFNGMCQIKSIIVIGGPNKSSPSKMKAYLNKENLDFGNITNTAAIQEWNLHEDPDGKIAYGTKITKFNNINLLTLYFPDNFGADSTNIQYIGLKGTYTNARREVFTTVYESRPQMSDHKNTNEEFVSRALD